MYKKETRPFKPTILFLLFCFHANVLSQTRQKDAPKQLIICYPPSNSSKTKHNNSLSISNYFKKYQMPQKNSLPSSSNNSSSVPEPQKQSDIALVDIQQSCA